MGSEYPIPHSDRYLVLLNPNAAGGQLDLKAGVDYLNATLYVYGNLSNAGRFDIF